MARPGGIVVHVRASTKKKFATVNAKMRKMLCNLPVAVSFYEHTSATNFILVLTLDGIVDSLGTEDQPDRFKLSPC